MHLVQEHSVFTWNPVDARWVHERGPEMATPPTRHLHAIQTYFFDPDGKEWIATVLAPRGRELAAQWQGAYKVPDRVASPTTTAKKSSPAPLLAVVLVLLIVGGGAAAVVAGTQSSPTASAAPTVAPSVSANPELCCCPRTDRHRSMRRPLRRRRPAARRCRRGHRSALRFALRFQRSPRPWALR